MINITTCNNKDIWDYFDIIFSILSSMVMFLFVLMQIRITLYRDRYDMKEYILETISKLNNLIISQKTYNEKKFLKITKAFMRKFIYYKYLISDKDWNKINEQFQRYMTYFSNKYENNYMKKNVNNNLFTVEEIEDNIMKIINPYLDIFNWKYVLKDLCRLFSKYK